MKAARISFVLAAAAIFAMGSAYAFHSGGVAECGGCHSMHSPAPSGSNLLVGADESSACLTCHEGSAGSYHISTAETAMTTGAPIQRTPGGDFGWLKKGYVFVVRGTTTTELGETHGHNIVADDFNYDADIENTAAPGGTYAAGDLGCQSCHDPHGKYRRLSDGSYAKTGAPIIGSGSYHNSVTPAAGEAVGSYRLLAGSAYVAGSGVTFTKDPPLAIAPATYNRTESVSQTRVAYGKGMSDWCAQCHADMHSATDYVHPVNQGLGGTVSGNYAAYKKSGDMTGTVASSYLSLVPFEQFTAAVTALQTSANPATNDLNGAASSDRVMCLSCHRAHASGWEYGLRWNMEGEFITYQGNWPGTDTTPSVPQFARGRTGAMTQAAYYDRAASTFATYQRVLCNKCHAQD